MFIDDDQFYHGAALIQIAEDPKFTSINPAIIKGKQSRSAYKVNKDLCVFIKYGTEPLGLYDEYNFTFTEAQCVELDLLATKKQVFLALVCVKDKEICGISYAQFEKIIGERKLANKGQEEETYTVLVTAKKGSQFRVYVNIPNRKGVSTPPLKVPRNRYPGFIFG